MIATPKLFTIDEYHRLIELGFLMEGDRIELIRGELIQMIAKGTPHTVCSSILCRQLDRLLGDALQRLKPYRAVIRSQDPITLPNETICRVTDLCVFGLEFKVIWLIDLCGHASVLILVLLVIYLIDACSAYS